MATSPPRRAPSPDRAESGSERWQPVRRDEILIGSHQRKLIEHCGSREEAVRWIVMGKVQLLGLEYNLQVDGGLA